MIQVIVINCNLHVLLLDSVHLQQGYLIEKKIASRLTIVTFLKVHLSLWYFHMVATEPKSGNDTNALQDNIE